MRLINKLNVYFFFGLLMILFCVTTIQYYYVSYRIDQRVQKTLIKEKKLLVKQINDKEKSEGFKLYKTEESNVRLSSSNKLKPNQFQEIYIYDEDENENVKYLTLTTRVFANNNYYDILIRKPLLQANDLISSIVISLIVILTILFVFYYILSRMISTSIFKPFYKTITLLRNYDVETGENVKFDTNVGTQEFDFLNSELEALTDKINSYFEKQQEFSQNAAHELQTPLSIIRTRCELMMQSKNLKEENLDNLNTILNAVDRISRINKSLVLLSKIDNINSSNQAPISFIRVLKDLIKQYEPMIEVSNIEFKYEIEGDLKIKINYEWAYILINNLIKNAINHNKKDGWITIILRNNLFTIENTGPSLEILPEECFSRFTKSSKTGVTGLGLAIVKDICSKVGLNINYTNESDTHKITLSS